jgi:hypothetical protein
MVSLGSASEYPASIQNNFSSHRPVKGTKRAFTLNKAITARSKASGAAFVILGAITFCHLLNDVMQALLPAIYPMLKSGLLPAMYR